MPQWLSDILPYLAPVVTGGVSWFVGRRQAKANTDAKMSDKFGAMASASIEQINNMYTKIGDVYQELSEIKSEFHNVKEERDAALREIARLKKSNHV